MATIEAEAAEMTTSTVEQVGPFVTKLLPETDIIVGQILPFLGPGNYFFLAGVNRRMKELYQEYFHTIPKLQLPVVIRHDHHLQHHYQILGAWAGRALVSDTLLTNLFYSQSGVEYFMENRFNHQLKVFRIFRETPMFSLAHIALAGNMETLEWAFHSQPLFFRPGDEDSDSFVWGTVARRGNLDVLKWLHSHGIIGAFNADTCAQAARGGHLDVLMWARQNGCPWNSDTTLFAAAGGHLDVLKWAHQNGCQCPELICPIAANRGQVNVLKWLKNIGCSWNKAECFTGAQTGNAIVVEWMRVNGRPDIADQLLSKEALEWAWENACPHLSEACVAGGGHLAVHNWLLSLDESDDE